MQGRKGAKFQLTRGDAKSAALSCVLFLKKNSQNITREQLTDSRFLVSQTAAADAAKTIAEATTRLLNACSLDAH